MLHDFLSTFMMVFFMLVDSLFIQCALKCKKWATLIKSSYGWLVGFVALRPKSTAMVIAGRSVHLTTLFPGQA